MDQRKGYLEPGTLWPALRGRFDAALRAEAIHAIPTITEVIEDHGIAFQIRLVSALERKPQATALAPGVNPFLPYDPAVFVSDISPTHVALLNKFYVVEHHLLIVTREFEPQEALLTLDDCAALLLGLSEIDGLAFYNAGAAAGASQPHKHLQLIPLPDGLGLELPIEPLFREAGRAGGIGSLPGLPFLHAWTPMDPTWVENPAQGAVSLFDRYRELLGAVNLSDQSGESADPYNLLATRRWLFIIPRSRDSFEQISVNALGFAGALLVKRSTEIERLREAGPMTALRQVALPTPSASS